jgi:hypothetical protein
MENDLLLEIAMATIYLNLKNCVQLEDSNVIGIGCPHAGSRLTKGFGYATDYFCKLNGGQVTSGYVEWNSDIKSVPDWCPLKLNKE